VATLVCTCSCPDLASAERMAEALVGERLAACVQLLPGLHSVYRWHGEVERADEVLLLIKTTRERLDALGARVRALHPYELPELLAVEAPQLRRVVDGLEEGVGAHPCGDSNARGGR